MSRPSKLFMWARLAVPLDEDEWGSGRQIDAENGFCAALRAKLTDDQWWDFERYALKATTEEMIGCGLELAGEPPLQEVPTANARYPHTFAVQR